MRSGGFRRRSAERVRVCRLRAPRVSVLIAAWNAGAFLERAVASAQNQTLSDIEIIIVDDCSTDDTRAIAMRLAADDPRIRVASTGRNSGPAAARNVALDLARGEWVAVLDADDAMEAERLEILVDFAQARALDCVFDDLICTPESAWSELGQPLLRLESTTFLDLARYVDGNRVMRGTRALGFLKPIFLRSALRRRRLRYDASLRIGEDFHLVLDLLALGGRAAIHKAALYRYIIRGESISKTLSIGALDALLGASRRFAARRARELSEEDVRALARRDAEMEALKHYKSAAQAAKAGRYLHAAGAFVRKPLSVRFASFAIAKRLNALKDFGG